MQIIILIFLIQIETKIIELQIEIKKDNWFKLKQFYFIYKGFNFATILCW